MSNQTNPTWKYKYGTAFTWIVVISLLLSGCAGAQPKVYHVGILASDGLEDALTSFKSKMTELGYVEGKNITYDVQRSASDPAQVQKVVKQFVTDKVDLIYAFPANNAFVAKAGTAGTNIQVVFSVTTIEGSNLVKSVREPGGNVTGVRYPAPELTAKRLELLLQMAPKTKRIWIGYQAGYSPAENTLKQLKPAAARMGLSLIDLPAHNLKEVQADLEAREQASDLGMDAIFIIPDSLVLGTDGWPVVSAFANKHKLPIAGFTQTQPDDGALFAYFVENSENGSLAASLADRIFKGTPAGSIPVVTPKTKLIINYKVAQALGLTLPEGLLAQADKIIR